MLPDHKGTSRLPRAVLAKIHIAKKELALSDEDYRDLLERVTGHRSAAEIDPDQVAILQRELRRLGWPGYLKPYTPDVPLKYEELGDRPGFPTPSQLRKLNVLFNTIPGYSTINPEKAFRAFLKKRFRIEDVRFLDEMQYESALNAVRQIRLRMRLGND